MPKDVEKNSSDEQNLSKKELRELKKQEKREMKQEKKANRSKASRFIKLVLTIVIILFAIFMFLYFDIFNVRSKYVDDKIDGTPIASVFESAKNASNSTDNVASRGELLTQIDDLESQVEKLEEELASEQDKNELYARQISQMKPLVDEQLEFKEEKEEFDTMIAENDPDAYQNFYESIYPETAEEIYRSIVTKENLDDTVNDYISTFSSMDESDAADILDVMSSTDLDLVVSILSNMSPDKSGAILSEMETDTAAKIAKRMAPVAE